MLVKFLLKRGVTRAEIVGVGHKSPLNFSVLAPFSEVAFIEELIEEELGTLKLDPAGLFDFLSSNTLLQSKFESPKLIFGSLDGDENDDCKQFRNQTLGRKLVISGLLTDNQLDELLDEYKPFAGSQRFGEFLKLKLQIPWKALEFFLDSSMNDESDFNRLRLGERLVELGMVSQSSLDDALETQKQIGGRIGDILVEKKAINPELADFFSKIKLGATGEIIA